MSELNNRIDTVVDYILDGYLYGPVIEACRSIKYETPEERTSYDPVLKMNIIRLDMHGLAKAKINDYLQECYNRETAIWRPTFTDYDSYHGCRYIL